MREDILPIVSFGLFSWSCWEFYEGNQSLAFFLLGAAVYVAIVIGVVFMVASNTVLDKLFRSSEQMEDRLIFIASEVTSIANRD